MSISSDILALAPYLYWKLDDPTGPAASDSSGNGRAGVYGGAFALHQYGPEPGTFAAQFGATATVQMALPFSPLLAHTYMAWVSIPAFVGGINDMMGLGTTGTNGTAIQTTVNAANYSGALYGAAGGLGVGSSPIPLWNRWWHHVAFSYTVAGTLGSMYIDGILTGTNTRLPRTAGGDVLYIRTPTQAVMAHFALWNSVLTALQIGVIAAHTPQWPFGQTADNLGGLSSSDPVVSGITTDLSTVLASVRKTY